MATTRERVINTVFPNRGAIANAAAALHDGRARARDRAEVERALAASRFAPPDRRPNSR
ncbi:MAG: hypothetical protein QOG53_1189 [Frankiales bacterium]|jgi:hypothetical protein|nr:hypothetical protein [Frankiales bacterium]